MRQDNVEAVRHDAAEVRRRSAPDRPGTTAITEAERGRSSNHAISPKSSPWPRMDRITSRPSSSLTTTLGCPWARIDVVGTVARAHHGLPRGSDASSKRARCWPTTRRTGHGTVGEGLQGDSGNGGGRSCGSRHEVEQLKHAFSSLATITPGLFSIS